MRFFAYVIKSIDQNFYYKGHCENIESRLKQHNSGMTASIKKYIPFKLAYSEKLLTREEAIKRERYLNQQQGGDFSRVSYL